jgi:hypothetical protein
MDVFPFIQADWQRVEDASRAVTNATMADDAVLRASQFAELVAVLEELRERYGDHPILLETEADFLDDPSLQLHLYRSAIRLAEQNALPTFTIRISLARLLLEEFADPKQAEKELAACHWELSRYADDYEKNEWYELMSNCDEAQSREMAHLGFCNHAMIPRTTLPKTSVKR